MECNHRSLSLDFPSLKLSADLWLLTFCCTSFQLAGLSLFDPFRQRRRPPGDQGRCEGVQRDVTNKQNPAGGSGAFSSLFPHFFSPHMVTLTSKMLFLNPLQTEQNRNRVFCLRFIFIFIFLCIYLFTFGEQRPLLAACRPCTFFPLFQSLFLPLFDSHTHRYGAVPHRAQLRLCSVLCGEAQRTTVARKRRVWRGHAPLPSSDLFFLLSQHSLLCCRVRCVVMEAEIHVYVLLFQQYGRKSLGSSIISSVLPLKNEKKAISARVTVKNWKKNNFTHVDNWTTLEVPVENVCCFLF